MIQLLTNPQWARFHAKFFLPLHIGLLGVVLLVSTFVFGGGIFVSLGIVAIYFALLWVFHLQGNTIKCDHCSQHIATNTPWICGFRGCRNDNVDEFPFVNKCQYCGAEPKAYQCHHCKGLIFLGRDHLLTGFARCAFVQSEEQKPPIIQESERLRQELYKTHLEADLARQKQALEELQKPSSRRKREFDALLGEAHDKLAAMADLFELRKKWRKETSENPNLTAEQKQEQIAEIERTVEEIRMQFQ